MPIESILGTLSLFCQVSFIAKRDKEQKQRITVVLPFVFLTWIVESVIRENTLIQSAILCSAIFVYPTFDIVGNKVIEALVVLDRMCGSDWSQIYL